MRIIDPNDDRHPISLRRMHSVEKLEKKVPTFLQTLNLHLFIYDLCVSLFQRFFFFAKIA